MSSSYLPLLFFRRDDDNEQQQLLDDDAARPSSSMDSSREVDDADQPFGDDEDEEENEPSSWHTRQASSILMEYSDTDDDGRHHFPPRYRRASSSLSTSNSPPTTPSWLTARINGGSDTGTVDDESDNSSRQSSWMKQLADSFRPKKQQQQQQVEPRRRHQRRRSSKNLLSEYPQLLASSSLANKESDTSNLHGEESPLLGRSSSKLEPTSKTMYTATPNRPLLANSKPDAKNSNKVQPFYTALAASFLQDYEANRRPILGRGSNDVSKITWHQLQLHQIKYSSWFFSANLFLATLALFVSSALEEQGNVSMDQGAETQNASSATISKRLWLTGLNAYAICVLALDLWIRNELETSGSIKIRRLSVATLKQHQRQSHLNGMGKEQRGSLLPPMQAASLAKNDREARSNLLVKPLILFLLVFGLETMGRLGIAYFALNKAGGSDNIGDGHFDDYSESHFPSDAPGEQDQQPMILFSSLLKPLVLFYVSCRARDALEALGRILRIVIRVLAMELLIILMFAAVACRLFRDFDAFHDLSKSWLSLFQLSTTVVNPSLWMPMYEASKYSAFFFIFFIIISVFYLHSLVLSVNFQTYVSAASEIHERGVADREEAVHLSYLALRQHDPSQSAVATESVRRLLCHLRPHYNSYKINALVDIVAPEGQIYVDYSTYRTKIRQALNASIRTARTASTLAISVEILAVVVAIVNFLYVVLVSTALEYAWIKSIQVTFGCGITIVAALELLVRFNPLRISDFTPLTRLNATFDGLALLAVLASSVGMVLYASCAPMAMEVILTGRAVDIFRVMRFFALFREVVRRSADVLPLLVGPCVLVVTTLHVFVYLGTALWGGAVAVGQHEHDLAPLYDLNNFNSYHEGLVTMFNVLVVNDWHAVAEVFLYADRCSSPFIVMPFFVLANLIGVSIMLNVMTAFFEQAFVTKLDDDTIAVPSSAHKIIQQHKLSDSSARVSEDASVRVSLNTLVDQGSDVGADADSEGSSDSDFLEFDVYEREGLDKIMQTVAGGPYAQTNVARDICDCLELFEKLASDREPVGYLLYDQLTMERFGNSRIQTLAAGFVEPNELHFIVSEMHAELLALADRSRSLIRTYPHCEKPVQESLEITAALLRKHPALSLFVSRRRTKAN